MMPTDEKQTEKQQTIEQRAMHLAGADRSEWKPVVPYEAAAILAVGEALCARLDRIAETLEHLDRRGIITFTADNAYAREDRT